MDNGLSRRRQGFKSPWGRQRNHALTRNRKGFFRFEAFSKNVRASQRLFICDPISLRRYWQQFARVLAAEIRKSRRDFSRLVC